MKTKANPTKATKPGRPVLTIREILAPTDFSDCSKKALRYAVTVAKQFGAKITLLHVIEPPVAYPDAGYYPFGVDSDIIIPAARASAEKICKAEKVDPRLIRETLIQDGMPYQEIVRTAKARKTDLIVIATHGHTGLAHVLLGSTAERVVRHAQCPVLVVPGKERKFASS